jgi:GT2 family glycosyltransferase
MSRITASIVLYNTPESQLARLLNCIKQSTLEIEIFLIDNSPVPLSELCARFPWTNYIRSERNKGYGAGHNLALRKVIDQSKYHFVLNPDIYFEARELEKLIHFISEDPEIGQVMPKIVYPNGELQYLCKLLPTPMDLFLRRFFRGHLREIGHARLELFDLRFTNYNSTMDIPYLSGCFMLLRTSALSQIGLFDERFFMYPEDIDLTRRMHARFRTVFYPGATVVHDHAQESYKSWKALWTHMYNIAKYFNKWGWIFDAERRRVNRETLRQLQEAASQGDSKKVEILQP